MERVFTEGYARAEDSPIIRMTTAEAQANLTDYELKGLLDSAIQRSKKLVESNYKTAYGL
jgi:hypothetical protein